MKHGKTPTRKQKDLIRNAHLNPDNWLVVKSLNGRLYVVNRQTNRQRILSAK